MIFVQENHIQLWIQYVSNHLIILFEKKRRRKHKLSSKNILNRRIMKNWINFCSIFFAINVFAGSGIFQIEWKITKIQFGSANPDNKTNKKRNFSLSTDFALNSRSIHIIISIVHCSMNICIICFFEFVLFSCH